MFFEIVDTRRYYMLLLKYFCWTSKTLRIIKKNIDYETKTGEMGEWLKPAVC